MKNEELNNYCNYCGFKLRAKKKGYAGKNRRFHNTSKCYKDRVIDKSCFNYIHKATDKTPTDDDTRQKEYDDYLSARRYIWRKQEKELIF